MKIFERIDKYVGTLFRLNPCMFDKYNKWLRLSSIKFVEFIGTQLGMVIPQATMKNIATIKAHVKQQSRTIVLLYCICKFKISQHIQ